LFSADQPLIDDTSLSSEPLTTSFCGLHDEGTRMRKLCVRKADEANGNPVP
jgi:hypothetical protein